MKSVQPIRVKGEKEFERLRDRIDLEVSHAGHHWQLLKGIEEASVEYAVEMNESNTFWYLTLIAHHDAVLSHLGRLYDNTTGALSLPRFLKTVCINRAFFSDAAFKERVKDNPHIETLVKDRPVDDARLDAEIETVSVSDPLVKKLHFLRNKTIAHTDADSVVRAALGRRSLDTDDVETLLSRASGITTKYSLYFRASCYGGIAGADDFKSTLRWVREALSAHHAEIERQIEGFKGKGSRGVKPFDDCTARRYYV